MNWIYWENATGRINIYIYPNISISTNMNWIYRENNGKL
jgi:hypothetical protein